MKIDEQTIRSLLAEQNILKGIISHPDGSVGLDLLIERLTAGINVALSTAEQSANLRDMLFELKKKYDEDCAELDEELVRLVDACKHPSQFEHPDLEMVYICHICGGLVEEEMF